MSNKGLGSTILGHERATMSDLSAHPAPQFSPPTHPAPAETLQSQVPAPPQVAPQPPVATQSQPAPLQYAPPTQPAPVSVAPQYAPPTQPAPAPATPQYAPPTQPAPQAFDPAQPFDAPQSNSVAQPQYADQAYDPHANPYAIPRDKPETGNGKIIAAYILALFSVFILPIILGPAAIFLASKAKNEGNPNGATAMTVAIGAMCLGFVFGFLALGAIGS